MTFLPIVERELRVAARRTATYWTRLGAAGLALLVGGWVLIIPAFQSPQTLGIVMFGALSVVAYTYCLFAGVLTTADCLSEEKREGTLGLLFLTDLKGYDIILGKLAATSVNVLYGVLAVFPVMAIPLLLGGVSVNEFWRVALASLTNLIFSLSIGIFVSAVSTDERRAMSACVGLLLLFTAGLPMLGSWVASLYRSPLPDPVFFIPSPGYASYMAFDEPFLRSGFNYYYPSIVCLHVLSWILLGLACVIVPRTWQDKAQSGGGVRRRAWRERIAQGSATVRLAIRRRMLEINPFYWLAGKDRVKPIAVWTLLAAIGVCWLWGLIKYPADWLDTGAYVGTAIISHTLLKVWLASEAARRFAADRKSGALELLLATPFSVKEILQGQLMALRRQFLGPLIVVLVADLCFLCADRKDTEMVWLWCAGIIVLVADVITLAWVGMWMGVSSRNTNRASGATVVRIMVLPWVIYLLSWTALTLLAVRAAGPAPKWFESFLFTSWIGISLAIDLIFGLRARQRLYADFRTLATQRFESRQLQIVKKAEQAVRP